MRTKIPPPIVALISILLTYLSRDYLGFFHLNFYVQQTLYICLLYTSDAADE